jgi:hypothetical protein
MAQKNPRKKAFIRIDASGRVIPGSVVLRVSKPKIGRWVQITSDVCCETTTA